MLALCPSLDDQQPSFVPHSPYIISFDLQIQHLPCWQTPTGVPANTSQHRPSPTGISEHHASLAVPTDRWCPPGNPREDIESCGIKNVVLSVLAATGRAHMLYVVVSGDGRSIGLHAGMSSFLCLGYLFHDIPVRQRVCTLGGICIRENDTEFWSP